MNLLKYFKEENIFFIDKTDKLSVLNELVAKSLTCASINNPDEFYHAILERENLMSTGIGLGVAIPHAKLSVIEDFFICLGVLNTPVEWDSIDKKPVQLVFLIGGPAESQIIYLQILARLMLIIKDNNLLKKIKKAQKASEIFEIFKNFNSSEI